MIASPAVEPSAGAPAKRLKCGGPPLMLLDGAGLRDGCAAAAAFAVGDARSTVSMSRSAGDGADDAARDANDGAVRCGVGDDSELAAPLAKPGIVFNVGTEPDNRRPASGNAAAGPPELAGAVVARSPMLAATCDTAAALAAIADASPTLASPVASEITMVPLLVPSSSPLPSNEPGRAWDDKRRFTDSSPSAGGGRAPPLGGADVRIPCPHAPADGSTASATACSSPASTSPSHLRSAGDVSDDATAVDPAAPKDAKRRPPVNPGPPCGAVCAGAGAVGGALVMA